MNKTEIIETILMKITRDPEFWRRYGTRPQDIGDVLKAGDASYEARALHALKSWVTADERVFFYTSPMNYGQHMAHMGVKGDFFPGDQAVEDSEYWAIAATLARAIKDNHFPIQEDVLNKAFDSNDEEIDALRARIKHLEDLVSRLKVNRESALAAIREFRGNTNGLERAIVDLGLIIE